MPIHDAPHWNMPQRVLDVVAEVAPAQRVFLGQLMDTLGRDGVGDFNDRLSFAVEVLAAQANLLADKLKERSAEIRSPERAAALADDDYLNIIVSDIFNRAQLRRLRGDDT